MSQNPQGASDYSMVLEDNSWAGDYGSRSARQSGSGESSNMAQRPLHVYKYMHIHEYMKGKQYTQNGALGTSGVHVRDGNRGLHITSGQDEDEGASRRRSGDVARGRSKGRDGDDEFGRMYPPVDVHYLNKGHCVWEAVRREWRGGPDAKKAARQKLAAGRDEALSVEEIEQELDDSDSERFSQHIPLTDLVEVLDEVWQSMS
mmetsp:Transcript_45886/g.109515  ORF Transcript_45886/g.109515 Transcript_45886/m.109515 type:complete len:203 (+) Transcript_45886:167-775(+)|eukprot:CAMPEP_0180160102 /NCGR_PEP_ID=MMETSP0986-20121125/27910_1 /TAXON_ID=697907 /ORGANISM="non described non described, Strain CCMP2293" /LENGTH=202 /DNA_ID=CAMNT_0022110295 /DNA_START=153 /DNA_END=761 /DNA_ORIENTATION=+